MSEWKTGWLSQHPFKLSMYYYISITDGGFLPINTGCRAIVGPTLFMVLGKNSLAYKPNQRRIHFIDLLVSKKTIECEGANLGRAVCFWGDLIPTSSVNAHKISNNHTKRCASLVFKEELHLWRCGWNFLHLWTAKCDLSAVLMYESISCSQTELFLSLHRCTTLQGCRFSVCLRAENTFKSLQGWGFYAVLEWML